MMQTHPSVIYHFFLQRNNPHKNINNNRHNFKQCYKCLISFPLHFSYIASFTKYPEGWEDRQACTYFKKIMTFLPKLRFLNPKNISFGTRQRFFSHNFFLDTRNCFFWHTRLFFSDIKELLFGHQELYFLDKRNWFLEYQELWNYILFNPVLLFCNIS